MTDAFKTLTRKQVCCQETKEPGGSGSHLFPPGIKKRIKRCLELRVSKLDSQVPWQEVELNPYYGLQFERWNFFKNSG